MFILIQPGQGELIDHYLDNYCFQTVQGSEIEKTFR